MVRAGAPEQPLSEPPPAQHFLSSELKAGPAEPVELLPVQYTFGAAVASAFYVN